MKNFNLSQSRFALVLSVILFLGGCSSQESKDSFDTLLCWLRPSCLPSHSSSARSRPSRHIHTPPAQQIPVPPPCRTTAKTTITAKNQSVAISYTEPTTQADGSPLTNLAKTSIYRNHGKGFIRTKDVPATNAKGGGQITETVFIAVGPGETLETTICVTATNSLGVEG